MTDTTNTQQMLIEALEEKTAAFKEAQDDLVQLRKDNHAVFEQFDELTAEMDALVAQMKALAKDKLQLPIGAKSLKLPFGFIAQRSLKTRVMDERILDEMLDELGEAGLLKPPSFAQIEKAVEEGRLPADALAYAQQRKADPDLVVGEDYTITIKVPKA